MAIAKKHHRKLQHNGQPYLWYVREDPFGAGSVVRIISVEGSLQVSYNLGQSEEECMLTVTGSDFVRSDLDSAWKRFYCPRFDPFGVITPKGVAAIIEWCLSPVQREQMLSYAIADSSLPDVEGYKKMMQQVKEHTS